MPIYEYQCANCTHFFELIQKMSDAQNELCPQCKQSTAVRLVSAAGFQLKGTGWYETDFKHKGKPKEKPVEQSEAAPTPTPAEKTTTEPAAQSSTTQGDDK